MRPSRDQARRIIQMIADSIPIAIAEHPAITTILELTRKSLLSVLGEDTAIIDDDRALRRFGLVLSGFARPVGSAIGLYRRSLSKIGRAIEDGEIVQLHATMASLGAELLGDDERDWPKPVAPCEGPTFRRARARNGSIEIYDDASSGARPVAEVK